MAEPRRDTILRVIRHLRKEAKKNDMSLDTIASIYLGLDDAAHNRLYTLDTKTGKTKKVPHYGDKRYASSYRRTR